MEIYEAVVIFLPCMQTSISWEVTVSPGILKSFLSHWVCLGILKIYMSKLCCETLLKSRDFKNSSNFDSAFKGFRKLFLSFSEFDFQRAFSFTLEICVVEKVQEGKAGQ